MRRFTPLLFLVLALARPSAQAAKPLQIYFIDVEGGQATLFVTPSGQSMLIDTGFPGNEDRDVKRVLETMKRAGVSSLDYVLVTHYHTDHVGNVSALAAKVPIGTFVDHGETVEESGRQLYEAYVASRRSGKH